MKIDWAAISSDIAIYHHELLFDYNYFKVIYRNEIHYSQKPVTDVKAGGYS